MAGWMSHAGIVSKRLKISSDFCLGLLWLWFSSTALRSSYGKGSLPLEWKTVYDPVACRYINTPSAYDTAVRQPASCRYFSSLRMTYRHAGYSASAELLVYIYICCFITALQISTASIFWSRDLCV